MPQFTTNILSSQISCKFRITATDSNGNATSVETGDISINPATENPHTGSIIIDNISPSVGDVLTGSLDGFNDVDGVVEGTFSWRLETGIGSDGYSEVATGATYTVPTGSEGKRILLAYAYTEFDGDFRVPDSGPTNAITSGSIPSGDYLTTTNAVDVSSYISATATATITNDTEMANLPTLLATHDLVDIAPKDYSAVPIITLNVSGTSGNKKVIRLQGGGDVNPQLLASTERAILPWIHGAFSHIVFLGLDMGNAITSYNGSGNIFHNMRGYGVGSSIAIRGMGNYTGWMEDNICQFGYFERMQTLSTGHDGSCFALSAWDVNGTQSYAYNFRNNIMVGCEIKDCNQGIQLVANDTNYLNNKFDGTIYEGNSFYYTSAIYVTDAGAPDVNGTKALGEGFAFVFKGGSTDAANPIKIFRNYMSGVRDCFEQGAKSSWGRPISQSGTASFKFDSAYTEIHENVIDDCNSGVLLDEGVSVGYSVNNNVFRDIQNHSSDETPNGNGRAIWIVNTGSGGITQSGNRFINAHIPVEGIALGDGVVNPSAGTDLAINTQPITNPTHTITIPNGSA